MEPLGVVPDRETSLLLGTRAFVVSGEGRFGEGTRKPPTLSDFLTWELTDDVSLARESPCGDGVEVRKSGSTTMDYLTF